MSNGMSAWRQRRQAARNRRVYTRAVDSAMTPAMEHELLTLALTRQGGFLR